MSKDCGPAANSFTEPRLTGQLTKQGGQGFTTNWRKRYFVLDHHYLFYYKSDKDRKPVGVVCLSDYKSCHKATLKESKKSKFTFVIEKGDNVDELDYPVRSYYIYAETDNEMNTWIDAINAEIQPLEGGGGRRGPKVDIKAFDELSTSVDGGVKLSHPTAARPKPQGRRPPRKYTPFHEDDGKDDTSPALPRRHMSQSSVEEYHSPSRGISPQSSEEERRGHHPSVPLKPKVPCLEEKKPEDVPLTPDHTPSLKPADPTPSKSPDHAPSKPMLPPAAKPRTRLSFEKDSTPPTQTTPPAPPTNDNEDVFEEKVPVTMPHPPASKPTPPLPPAKPKNKRSIVDHAPPTLDHTPSLIEEESTDVVKTRSASSITEKKFTKPSPPRKLKRNNQTASLDMPTIKPVDTPTTKPLDTPTVKPQDTPTTKPKPKPRTKVNKDRSSIATEEGVALPDGLAIPEGEVSVEGVASIVGVVSEEDDIKQLDDSLADMQQFIQDNKKPHPPDPTSPTNNPTVRKVNYENVTVNMKHDGQLTLSAPDAGNHDDTETTPTTNEASVDPKTENVVEPRPSTPPTDVDNIYDTPKTTPTPTLDTTTIYDVPSPVKDTPSESLYDTPAESLYDMPKSPVVGTPPSATPPSATPPCNQDRLSVIENEYDLPSSFSISQLTTPTPSTDCRHGDDRPDTPTDHKSPERDAWGYAVVNKKRKVDKQVTMATVPGEDMLAAHVQLAEDILGVPESLHKAKEILRLAMVVKREVLEMREEVENELALARRERHDSQLMKQNAAEILKMAKEVLQKVNS